MMDKFLLFMKMLLTGIFKFAVGIVGYLVFFIGMLIVVEIIVSVKILTIVLLIVLAGAVVFALFVLADDFWNDYKRERDNRGL